MNYVLTQPLLSYFARGDCHEQMYQSGSHHYCKRWNMKIVQIRPPVLTCRCMLITQSCCQGLTSPMFDLAKWPH